MLRMKRSLQLCMCMIGIVLLCGCAAPVQDGVQSSLGLTTPANTELPTQAQTSTPGKQPTPTQTLIPTRTPATTQTPTTIQTLTQTLTPTPAPTQMSNPTQTPAPTVQRPEGSLQGIVIGIDPGHQKKGNSTKEPVAPGAKETKAKVSSGTKGDWSKVPEYEVTLNVGLRLKQLLEDAGATVIMSRETHDVNVSNVERAVMMNEAKCDLVLRIHCDGSDNASAYGASMQVPDGSYTTEIQAVSTAAGEEILNRFTEVTGARNRGVQPRDDLTGFNWSTVPVCLIEMGFMSNKQEDLLLASKAYQEKCAEGLYQGILLYFN